MPSARSNSPTSVYDDSLGDPSYGWWNNGVIPHSTSSWPAPALSNEASVSTIEEFFRANRHANGEERTWSGNISILKYGAKRALEKIREMEAREEAARRRQPAWLTRFINWLVRHTSNNGGAAASPPSSPSSSPANHTGIQLADVPTAAQPASQPVDIPPQAEEVAEVETMRLGNVSCGKVSAAYRRNPYGEMMPIIPSDPAMTGARWEHQHTREDNKEEKRAWEGMHELRAW
jgi:hypothetical protein